MAKTKEDKKKNHSKKKGCRVSSSSASSSCSEKGGVRMRRGVWSEEEDKILVDYITNNGHGTWRNLPKLAGLLRCGKSCRLRWTNYLRPGIKRGPFTPEEEDTIVRLQQELGNKWAAIASQLPGRTDNDVKNFWNSHLRKRFENKAIIEQPSSSSPKPDEMMIDDSSPSTHHMVQSYDSIKLEPQLHIADQQPWNLVPASDANRPAENDYFMRLWNSEVGESFRNINDSVLNQSPESQTSGSTKGNNSAEACKITTTSPSPSAPDDQKVNCKKEVEDATACSDSSESYETEDSMLKLLLLDFPVGGNDMGFLQGPSGGESSN